MRVKLLGFSQIDFTNKDGQQVKGINLFTAYKDERVIGLKTDKFFINSSIILPNELKPGDEIDISFNCKGRVELVASIK